MTVIEGNESEEEDETEDVLEDLWGYTRLEVTDERKKCDDDLKNYSESKFQQK